MAGYEWDALRADLTQRAAELAAAWLPSGRRVGRYWVVGSVAGEAGRSLRVDLSDGKWVDWATKEYGDLIDLYARTHGISVGEAARELSGGQYRTNGAPTPRVQAPKPPPEPLEPPPSDAAAPSLRHPSYGAPVASWAIRAADGAVLHYVARYAHEGHKEIIPWTWRAGRWVMKGPPAPRPLYGLHRMAALPDRGVLIVEGEKCADAATALFGNAYAVVTWTGGASAIGLADWTPVHGRRVVIWPDADTAGIGAGNLLAGKLVEHCPTVSLIDVSDMPEKWDVADATFASRTEAFAWMRARMHPYTSAAVVDLAPPDLDAKPFVSVRAGAEALNLDANERGVPTANLANAATVLREHPDTRGRLWFDGFARRLMIDVDSDTSEAIDDQTIRKWTEWMQVALGMRRISTLQVHEAAAMVCEERTINPVADFLGGLTWDGFARIDRFFTDFGGCPEDAYHAGVARTFWLSMVARALTPGCEVHQMVVAYGTQGLGKTSMFKAIAAPWFATSTDPVDSKDFFLSLRGALITEIGELDSFSKAEIGRVKLIITGNRDKYREPYARVATETPRAGILVGTVNERNFLHDHSGGRRFLPIAIEERIDLAYLALVREQLFAEAVARFRAGEPWYLDIDGAREKQEAARIADPWEDKARGLLVGKVITTPNDLLADLGIDTKDQTKAHVSRAMRTLAAIKWRAREDGRTWERPL